MWYTILKKQQVNAAKPTRLIFKRHNLLHLALPFALTQELIFFSRVMIEITSAGKEQSMPG